MVRVGIAGASGYAGGELIRLLANRADIDVGPLAAGGSAGKRLSEIHPALVALGERTFVETTAEAFANCDVAFLALPHGHSAELARLLPEEVRVIDLGADFRLSSAAAWQKYYGGTHGGAWTYGMPEVPGQRAQIAGARRVANPGCYATAVTLALAPVMSLVAVEDLVVVAASGTSGAGRKPTESLLGSEVMASMSAYKVGGVHQHTPEIEQTLASVAGTSVRLSFTPMLAPMSRGILATCTAPALPGVTIASVREALTEAYAHETFVTLLADGEWPRTSAVYGSNSVHLQVALDQHSGRIVVVAAIDNLVKGAAGQAVQNMNIMLGIDEGFGLPVLGVAP